MAYDQLAEAVENLHGTNRELVDSVLGEMTKFKVTTLAKLRTYSGNAKQVTVTDSVRGGDFYLDTTDITSNDNDGTVLVDQLGRRWKRYFIGSPSVLWFGAIGNGSADDTAAIKKAMAASNYLFWPGREYGISDTVTSTSDQVWSTDGEVKFTAIFGAGSPARPMFDFRGKITAPGNFVVDHRAHILNYGLPQAYFGNPIVGSAVLVQGDWSQIKGWQVINAWDNGIAVVALDPISGKEIAGSPKYGTCTDIKTALCGVGEHGGLTPGKIGAGIDIASASAWSVNDCVDYMSYIGFILDIGAGAQCQFSNCTAFYTKVDTNNPLNGSGYGFYVGSNESSFVNCTSIGAGYRGLWLDGANCEFTNFVVYIPQQEGVFIKNGQNRGTFRIKGAGAKQANTYDAVMIDCSARPITELHLDISTTGSNHRWGVNAVGNNTIDARIVGIVTGTTGKVNRQNYNIGTYFMSAAVGAGKRFGFNKDEPGFEVDILGKGRITASKANLSSITNLFGDNGDNGSFIVEDFLTPSKRGTQGWDPVNDWYALQAVHVNTAKKDIALNPGGGNVRGGKGTWDSCIVLGNTYIWADTTGALRRKIGAPTSATDGTLFT